MTNNSVELALKGLANVATQPSTNAVALQGAKAAAGLSEVPNELLPSIAGPLAGPLGQLAGGLASAIAEPDPSLTATVSANPSTRYGDRYVENLAGSGHTGGFQIQSGNSDANAENRGQSVGLNFSVWWIVGGVAAVALGWILFRRG